MSEQTVPDIYEWIEAMRDRAVAGMTVVEVEVDLTAPDPAYIPGSLAPTQFNARAIVESITFTGDRYKRKWEAGEDEND